MDQPGITVEIENDRLVDSEETTKSRSLKPCGWSRSDCILNRSTTLMKRIFRSGNSVRHCRCRKRFLGWDITSARHDQIRFLSLIIARLAPNADALRAVRDGGVHIHVLKMKLLIADDYIDVVLATQTMISHRQQSIDIWRHVYPRYLGPFIDHYINEAGILMSKAVMILSPNRGSDQQIQRRIL